MLLDEKSLRIMGNSFNWDEEKVMAFINSHASTLMDLIKNLTLGKMAEEEPEKLAEINKLSKEQDAKSRVNAMQALEDHAQMALLRYPELQEEITAKIEEFDHKVFFDYLQYGPVDGAVELLEYMQSKVELFDDYDKVVDILKDRLRENEVDQVLNSNSIPS